MEQIKNAKQLRFEQARLQRRRAELENVIRQDWGNLEKGVRKGSVAARRYYQFLNRNNKKGTGIFSRIFSVVADNLNLWINNTRKK
jgi:hypothetical protein